MSKMITIIATLLALIGGGAWYINSVQEEMPADSTIMTTNHSPDQTVSQGGITTAHQSAIAGQRYLEYSADAFTQNQQARRVLFFYASWCPTCRPADEAFKQHADKIPSDIVLFRVNYDTEADLKQRYQITYQHTFVLVDEEGAPVKKWNGGDIDQLLSQTTT